MYFLKSAGNRSLETTKSIAEPLIISHCGFGDASYILHTTKGLSISGVKSFNTTSDLVIQIEQISIWYGKTPCSHPGNGSLSKPSSKINWHNKSRIYIYEIMKSQFLKWKWYKALTTHNASAFLQIHTLFLFFCPQLDVTSSLGKKQNSRPRSSTCNKLILTNASMTSPNMVDGRNPAITSWYGIYPVIYMVLYIPHSAEFLPSIVSQRKCKFMPKTLIIWVMTTLEVLSVCIDRMLVYVFSVLNWMENRLEGLYH